VLFLQSPLYQDMPLALRQLCQRLVQEASAIGEPLVFGEAGLRARTLVDQPVLQLSLTLRPERRVQRSVSVFSVLPRGRSRGPASVRGAHRSPCCGMFMVGSSVQSAASNSGHRTIVR
jgi:hypothetical protein